MVPAPEEAPRLSQPLRSPGGPNGETGTPRSQGTERPEPTRVTDQRGKPRPSPGAPPQVQTRSPAPPPAPPGFTGPEGPATGLTRNEVAVLLLLLLVRELGAGLGRGAAALRNLAVARGLVAGLAEPRVGSGPLGGDGAAAREPAHTHRTRGAT